MHPRKPFEWLLIAIFLAAISTPLVVQLAGNAAGTESHEKRQLAKLPACPTNAASFWQYPDQFKKYYGDRFGLRATLIRFHALAMYRLLHTSPSDKVLAGRSGWFYYADDYSLEDYRSQTPLTPAELDNWRRVMEARQAWLAQRGAQMLLVFACDKYVIYPEYMPPGYQRANVPYRLEQLVDYLRHHSKLNLISLQVPLEVGKETDRLYHRTDTHWNDRGAYIGYREILAALRIPSHPLSEFRPVVEQTEGWDLARMMGLNHVISEENRMLIPHEPRRAYVLEQDRPDPLWNNGRVVLTVPDPALPRLVMFRDSFGSALVPFLAEHFNRSVFLWQYDFDPAVIEREKPQFVVWLMTSRRLQWFAPVNPPLP